MSQATERRFAVVTGSNKGIGFEIVKQLASNGINVVLTSRDEKKGLEAVDKLKEYGLTAQVFFNKLDVADPASVISLADFLRTQFGKLDILVNNAGIGGSIVDVITYLASVDAARKENAPIDWTKSLTQTYELAEECLQINYYGTKRTSEALIPLLHLSTSPRIVNVSSSSGKLKNISNDWAEGVFSDVEGLTEEKIDKVLSEFLKDFKDSLLENKGWPTSMSAYIVSKAAVNAYTRILAKKHPNLRINCVCPGFVKSDMNYNTGNLSVEEGAASPVKLALLPNNGPTGLFFFRSEVSPF